MNADHPIPADALAADPAGTVRARFDVAFDYPVHFARDVLSADSSLLADVLDRLGEGRAHRVLAAVDAGLAQAQPDLVGRLKEYAHAHRGGMDLLSEPMLLPGGPAAKRDWHGVRDLLTAMGNAHLDRQSVLLAIGGGSFLDMAGFAASVVHRGVRLVRMPTTVLAQADAGIGVKNGMDEHGQKNFVGTFAPPFAVINDLSLLETLSDTHWVGGLSEAYKVAIIKDGAFLDWLIANADRLAGRDADAMARAVRRTAEVHLRHIAGGGDPFEFGSARPLDFGHWAAHRLEMLSEGALGHGEAVAVGIALDVCYAAGRGLLTGAERDRVLGAMEATGLPTWSDHLAWREGDRLAVLVGLAQFREHLGGRLTVTLPEGLGRRVEVHSMDEELIAACIADLQDRWLGRQAGPREGRP